MYFKANYDSLEANGSEFLVRIVQEEIEKDAQRKAAWFIDRIIRQNDR